MNIKELLKNLSSLTLYALLHTTFGALLIAILVLSDHAVDAFCNPVGLVVKAVLFILEMTLFLAVLDMAVNEVASRLKSMSSTVRPAVTYVRRRSTRGRDDGRGEV